MTTVIGALRRAIARARAREPNLVGDRDIEWSWIAGHIPSDGGEALDFGNGGSYLGLAAAQRGYNVTAVDLEGVEWPYEHPRLEFVRGDLLTLPFQEGSLDLVLNCSAVEHVGIAGRYGVDQPDHGGDLDAMRRLHALMKSGGRMLLTIPVGRDAVFHPMCRVYGRERLPRLLEGYRIQEEAYWVKKTGNRWLVSSREEALDYRANVNSRSPLRNTYALGLYVLIRV